MRCPSVCCAVCTAPFCCCAQHCWRSRFKAIERFGMICCRSELARDAACAVYLNDRGDTIASKLAPTGFVYFGRGQRLTCFSVSAIKNASSSD